MSKTFRTLVNLALYQSALMKQYPERVQRFIAIMNGKIVGHSCVFFTNGEYGVAGIYNVGVVPNARNAGIGKAVVAAACLYAKEKGYRYAVLNATGRRMYEQVGFQGINYGRTWWLMNKRYITDPPSDEEVQLAEAIGNGDIIALNQLKITAAELNKPINNGMTLMQLAVHFHQPLSVEWLINHGAAFTALDAWRLGWKDRAAEILKKHPEQVNQQDAEHGATLLHSAVERNDSELAKLALSANPDLEITDKIYGSTALGWAEHLKHKELADLIMKHMNK